MAPRRQPTLFEVYGLSRTQSNDEDDTIEVSRPAPQAKRKRINASDYQNDRPRKVGRTASATKLKQKPATVDRSSSDAENVIQVKPQRRRQDSKVPQSKSLYADPSSSRRRGTLAELSPGQVHNLERGPIAWYQTPSFITPGYLRQFSRRQSSVTSDVSSGDEVSAAPSSIGRSRRAAAGRRSYVSFMSSPDGSEDELAKDIRLSSVKKTTKTKARKKSASPQQTDDSDFCNETAASDEHSEESDIVMEDSSSVQPSETDVDVLPGKKTKSTKASKATTKATSSAKAPATTKQKATSKNMVNLITTGPGTKDLDVSQAPMSDLDEIFQDMTAKALRLGFDKAVKHLKSRRLRVATMCSGTESPLLALEMIRKSLPSNDFQVEHLFSAELVPFKQAYIERNFDPPTIFRDITELNNALKEENPMATTAYGAKVAIPLDLDMIIAGTSCVDYSGMNSRKKGIHDGGESGDTWHAVLEFCKVARPPIVLLENVFLAPWDDMLEDYRKIGYEPVGAKVNTKDYYIPHVRQRGYMACFDQKKLEAAGLSKGKAASQWATAMGDLRRPASSPVSDFLLPNDRIIRQQFRTDDPTREVDWSTCEIRQMQCRQELRLGNARPLTNWSASGSMLVPDNGQLQWYQRQVERVLDTIDVGNLRKALPKKGMYDNRFKTRVVDLSQNVDRETDHRPFGIVGCITPTGMFFISDAGRPLTAEETLKLQGLPLDKISFTTETPAEVQDLAGNAMSTTVIASSILSALIAGHKMVSHEAMRLEMNGPDRAPAQLMPSSKTKKSYYESSAETTHTASVLNNAARALRQCYCEGPKGLTTKAVQECSDCGHTTCIVCGGNPPHSYRQVPGLQASLRIPPGQFEQQLRTLLPLRLTLCDGEVTLPKSLSGLEDDVLYRERLCKTLMKTFSFVNVRRTYCWSATYQSDEATLELVMENDSSAEWRLFAHAPKDLPVNDRSRTLLRQPVARSRVQSTSKSLTQGVWEVRIPKATSFPMIIHGSGSKLASWWARNEMPDFLGHYVWENLTIDVDGADHVNGVYRHLPQCGTACNGLYKKVGDDTTPLYLFLDPTRIGSPKEDCFVFSHNKAVLEYDEVRPIVARIAPPWRPWSTDEKTKTLGIPETTKAKLVIDDVWQSLSADVKLSTEHTNLDISVPVDTTRFIESVNCTTAATMISCAMPERQTLKVLRPEHPGFFEEYSWIFEAMRRHLPQDRWLALRSVLVDHECESCAPARPELRWALSDNGNIVPQEDPSSAAAYERAIKSRPDPFLIQISPDGGKLDVGINITSLAHRAGARLRHHCGAEPKLSYVWRFTTGAKQAESFTFKPFSLSPTADIEPCLGDLGLEIDLFPKQRLALAWMRKQELGVDFMLEEVEESSIASLGWQAEVKAQTSVVVRGGICADHPGFGKTILSLALIESEWIEKGKPKILSEIVARQPAATTGLITIAATLIICPASLLKQWKAEIVAKVRDERTVITLNTMADFGKYNMANFETASIVLVNRAILGNQAYAERIATFAGVPGPAAKSGRSFAHWLRSVEGDIPSHVEILDRGLGLKPLQRHLKSVYKKNLESDRFKMSVPSRRLRGKEYVASKSKTTTSVENTAAGSEIDTTQIGRPLLEWFYFNRILVDEFHQYDVKELAAIAGLKADKRWGLSATPAIDDFYDVAQTASLLGVSLRTSSGAKGVLKAKNARALKKEMTSFEQFDLMRYMPSDSLHAHIHAADQRFLDTFVRRNIADFNDQLTCREHLVPARLDVSHMALYSEISQHLNSLEMRIKKANKSKATDRQQRFHSVTNECLTAEEALSKAAAFLDGDERRLDSIIAVRHRQSKEILALLPEAIRVSSSEEPIAFSHWKASRLDGGTLGDGDTIADVTWLVRRHASAKADKGQKAAQNTESGADSSDQAETKVSFAGKKAKTAKLQSMCERLLKAKRSIRYLQNVKQILAAGKAKGGHLCDNPACVNDDLSAERAGVSVLCGHLICSECHTPLKQQGGSKCLAQGCSESLQDIHLLWSHKMGDMSTPASPHSAKVEAASQLLRSIEEQRDQAILFVQYPDQLDQIGDALDDEKISATIVRNPSEAGKQVEVFRDSAGTTEQITVLVLNASDETAAGLNLQNANHAIFLSPLLRDSQYGYDSTMAQAIGRVRRYGQEKEIHIHRIFALDTIDVDILEHRERRISAITQQGGPTVAPPAAAKELDMHGLKKREKTQLVRERGYFSLRPQSWLVKCGADTDAGEIEKVKGKNRVSGWEDFSSLVKFSKTFTEDDDW